MALTALDAGMIAAKIEEQFPGATVEADDTSVVVESGAVRKVLGYLKDSTEFGLNYLTSVTGVDYLEYFEIVYHLLSMESKQTLVVKARCHSRENPELPSVTPLWKGADFQEREIYDLLGVRFKGHPNLKRIVMWEGFEGHPLRKDYL